MGHGLGCGGVTDVRGNVVLGDSVLVPFFTCVGQRPFLLCFRRGGTEMGVGFGVTEGGEGGVGSSHAS